MHRRVLVIVTVVSSLLGTTTGSLQAQSYDSRRSGYYANGRHFGYVPAHEKLEDLRKKAVKRNQPTLAEPPVDADGQVVPVSWHEMNSNRGSVATGGPMLGPASGDFTTFADEVILESGEVPSTAMGSPGMLSPEMVVTGGEIPGACEEVCCPTPWIWARLDYMLWWTDGMNVPALATTSPTGTSLAQAGVLRQPGTTILYGNDALNNSSSSGGRFTIGTWFDPCTSSGMEFTYFAFGEKTDTFDAVSDGTTILARPFFNVGTRLSDARLIGFDSRVEGSLSITADTQFQGLGILFRRDLTRSCFSNTALLLGYRWVQVNDGLLIEESTESLLTPNFGTTFDLFDQFDTENNFHGLDMGLSYQFLPNRCYPCWSVELLGKVAVGTAQSSVRINGQTTETAPGGAPDVRQGGLLTQPTNIGTYEQNEFAMVYEAGLTLRREFKSGWEFTMGYSFIYWSDVARAGDQVDFVVNPTQITGPLAGPARPEFPSVTTGFMAQGLHFGLEYNF